MPFSAGSIRNGIEMTVTSKIATTATAEVDEIGELLGSSRITMDETETPVAPTIPPDTAPPLPDQAPFTKPTPETAPCTRPERDQPERCGLTGLQNLAS